MKKIADALLSNAVYSLLSLLAFVILATELEPVVFGQWVIFITISTLIDQVRFGITRNATIQIIAQNSYHRSHIINGAGLRLCFKMMVVVSVISFSLWVAGRNSLPEAYMKVLLWYPLLGLTSTLWNNAQTWLQWSGRFKQITLLRVTVAVTFITQLVLMFRYIVVTIDKVILAFIISNILASLLSFFNGWDSSRHVIRAPKELDKQIFGLGRNSTVSNLGTILIKSSDILIIGFSVLFGAEGIAIYAIPFKAVEMLELPIQSIVLVGYNNLAEKFREGIAAPIRILLARYSILMAVLVIPAIILIGIYPEAVLNLLGGKRYISHYAQMRTILNLLLIYGILLIPDRLTTISLEVFGKPRLNASRLLVLATLNIIGNLIAVFYFESIIGVVFVSVVTVTMGIVAASFMLPKAVFPRIRDWISEFRSVFSKNSLNTTLRKKKI